MFIKQWCCFFCLLLYDLILVDVESLVVLFCFFPNYSRANSHDCCHVKHHLWFWLGCAMFQIAQCMSNSSDCGNVLLLSWCCMYKTHFLKDFSKSSVLNKQSQSYQFNKIWGKYFEYVHNYRSQAGENPHNAWVISKQQWNMWFQPN